MSTEPTSIPSPSPTGVRYELVAEPIAQPAAQAPIRYILHRLRGRIRSMLIVMVLLGAIGAVLGYNAMSPVYSATGYISVDGRLPSILYQSSDINATTSNIQNYVAEQATLLTGRPVLEHALSMPEMQDVGWTQDARGLTALQDRMTVSQRRGEQVISVEMAHPDPLMAQTAVNAVLTSYEKLYGFANDDSIEERTAVLQDRQRVLEEEIASLQAQLLIKSDQYGAGVIDELHDRKVKELMAIDGRLADLDHAITHGTSMSDTQDALSFTEPASADPLADLQEQENRILSEIAGWSNRYGPKHPHIRELTRRLDVVRVHKKLRERSLRDGGTAAPVSFAETTPDADESLTTQRDALKHRRDTLSQEAAQIGAQLAELTRLTEALTLKKDRLAQTQRRLDEVQVEGTRTDRNRVRILAYAELPLKPSMDRRAGTSFVGMLFGSGLGFGIFCIIGMLDMRCRHADMLAEIDRSIPLLAVLPNLDHADAMMQYRACQNVHELRNLLQLSHRTTGNGVYAVTSTADGEGKTSLALALAASYASAGRKTLIIDADCVHCTLSRELRLTNSAGLCQAVGEEGGSAHIHKTDDENLWALPVGSPNGFDPRHLSPEKLRWIIEALRGKFDAIIIDSGSILTSLEATLAAGVADGTILLVSRDRHVSTVKRSLERLSQIGATCAGLVFNRASVDDLSETDQRRTKSASLHIAQLVTAIPNQVAPFALHPSGVAAARQAA